MSHLHLSDTDLANAELDLTSWILQDDLYQQDFCYGAKDIYSSSAGHQGLSTISSDLPDDLVGVEVFDSMKVHDFFPSSLKEDHPNDDTSVIAHDEDFDLQNLMKQEIIQQQQLQQLEFFRQQEEKELSNKLKEQELQRIKVEQELLQQFEKNVCQNQQIEQMQEVKPFKEEKIIKTPIFQSIDSQDVLYFEEVDVGSPGKSDPSFSSPTYYISSPNQVEFSKEVDNHNSADNKPCIISVPVSEAFSNENSVVPSIKVSSPTSSSDDGEEFVYDFDPQSSQKFIINLRKVSVPKISNQRNQKRNSETTVKDMLESDEADAFIRELVSSPTSEVKSTTNPLDLSDDEMSSDNSELCVSDQGSVVFSPANSFCSTSTYSDYPDSPCTSKSRASTGSRNHPYSSVEKKLRKKEQNKRAALRYRQKKKDEEGTVLTVLGAEQERQKKLLDKYQSVKMELKLMKKIAREMLVAQGKLPN